MTVRWTLDELAAIGVATELEIAVRDADGALETWTPIWVVRADEQVFVRTWYRRNTGWFGRALTSRSARIRVPGLVADVTVLDVGGAAKIRGVVDAAYRAKYGDAGAAAMVSSAAAATTLRLDPDR